MTESEWLASEDPARMLRFLTVRAPGLPSLISDRKLRLFEAACLAISPCEHTRAARPNVEALADNPQLTWQGASSGEWHTPIRHAETGIERLSTFDAARGAALLREIVGNPFRPVTLPVTRTEIVCDSCGRVNPTVNFSDLRCLRCSRGVATVWQQVCPWLTPTVLSLAAAAYDERSADGTLDNARLAVLSDALEEAGCDSAELLMHLRGQRWAQGPTSGDYYLLGTGPHVRGCWALDLVLGKS